MTATKLHDYALCIDNRGFTASLDRMKVYRILPDAKNTLPGHIRVIDESGEDYLYPASMFHRLQLPHNVITPPVPKRRKATVRQVAAARK